MFPYLLFWNPFDHACSGLRVNHEKTEILALGNSILLEKDFNNHRICEIIKIGLGTYFGWFG